MQWRFLAKPFDSEVVLNNNTCSPTKKNWLKKDKWTVYARTWSHYCKLSCNFKVLNKALEEGIMLCKRIINEINIFRRLFHHIFLKTTAWYAVIETYFVFISVAYFTFQGWLCRKSKTLYPCPYLCIHV